MPLTIRCPLNLRSISRAAPAVVIGGVHPVVRRRWLASSGLTGPVLADIFLGKKMWNDAQITKLNPGLKLPAARDR